MEIKCLVVGLYETNCYVVRKDAESSRCVVIDTSLESDVVCSYLQQEKLEPKAVILTHGHADHIGGVAQVQKQFNGVKLYIHKNDARLLSDPAANLSFMTGQEITAGPADVLLEDSQSFEEAGIKFEVIHTPGHTMGGICLYVRDEKVLFSGDTLFAESVGRTDFPGGNPEQLIGSIKSNLIILPEDTAVYPGHCNRTTIGHETKFNPFLC